MPALPGEKKQALRSQQGRKAARREEENITVVRRAGFLPWECGLPARKRKDRQARCLRSQGEEKKQAGKMPALPGEKKQAGKMPALPGGREKR